MQMDRDIEIAGSFNSRDLGGYPTPLGSIAWRKLLRSGSLTKVNEQGKDTIRALGITRVIDLRSASECESAPEPFTDEDDVELLSIALFDNLDPTQEGTADVLLDHYIQALQKKGSVFVKILRAISSSPDAVLFHCTAGKDRTGLVAAIVLALLGVDNETIIRDYALSADRIQPLKLLFAEKAKELNLDVHEYKPLLACKAETMRAALGWLTEHYQSVSHYMQLQGFTEADLTQLQRFLGLEDKKS